MKTRIAVLALGVAGLTGCNQQVNCANEEGVSSVIELLQNEAHKRVMNEINAENIQSIGQSDVRAALSDIDISLHAFRTDKADPNSNKVFCAAELKYVIKSDKMGGLDTALSQQSPGASLSGYANTFDFERAANAFVSKVEYSVQPTDDRKMIYTETALDTSAVSFLETLVHAELLRASSSSSAKAARTTAHIAQIEQTAETSTESQPVKSLASSLVLPEAIMLPSALDLYSRYDNPVEMPDRALAMGLCPELDAPTETKCLGLIYAEADRALNEAYKRLQAAHTDLEGEINVNLRNAQREWIPNRDTCDQVNSAANALRCKIVSTQARTRDLNTILETSN